MYDEYPARYRCRMCSQMVQCESNFGHDEDCPRHTDNKPDEDEGGDEESC